MTKFTDIDGKKSLLKPLEIIFICLILLYSSSPLQDFSPSTRLRGTEISYLMSTGIMTSHIHRDTGVIPYWNPYMANGEPMIEGPFSFVLNPLMFIPVYIFNYAQSGKIVMLLHILVMGMGGWALGHTLGLRAPSRILMALLLGGGGSFVGASAQFQMAISQSYVPWVIAGVWGTLYTSKRRYIAMFIISFYLLITAGTFWYVLPTGIATGILAGFGILSKDDRLYLNWRGIRRLTWAGLLAFGISAIRWFPQLELQSYIRHPSDRFGIFINLNEVIRHYLYPDKQLFEYRIQVDYHYTVPLLMLLVLLVARLLVMHHPAIPKGRWRILVPACLSLIIFTLWSQGLTPLVTWFYTRFTFLQEWRILGRMGAAGAPWLVILLVVFFDDIMRVLQLSQQSILWKRWVKRGFIIALLTITISGTVDVLQNWKRVSGTQLDVTFSGPLLSQLQQNTDDQLLPVYTNGFSDYFPFYGMDIRASRGNPDIRIIGRNSTIGERGLMDYPAPYAIGAAAPFIEHLRQLDYVELTDESDEFYRTLWHNPDSPSYAFIIAQNRLIDRSTRLFRNETQSIETFTHQINAIEVNLIDYPPNSVLVLRESAIPGWRVTVDGNPAQLESIDGFIGVRLPFTNVSTVRFEYVPTRLFTGAGISLITILIATIYFLAPTRYRNLISQSGSSNHEEYIDK